MEYLYSPNEADLDQQILPAFIHNHSGRSGEFPVIQNKRWMDGLISLPFLAILDEYVSTISTVCS